MSLACGIYLYGFKFFILLAHIILVVLRRTEPVALALGGTGYEKIPLNTFPGKAQIDKGKGRPVTGYEGPDVE